MLFASFRRLSVVVLASSTVLMAAPVAHGQAISGPATAIGQIGSNFTGATSGPVIAAGGGGFPGGGAVASNTQHVSSVNTSNASAVSGNAAATGFYGGGYPWYGPGYGGYPGYRPSYPYRPGYPCLYGGGYGFARPASGCYPPGVYY